MGLENILKDIVALIPFPVGGLGGDDADPRRLVDRGMEAAQARIAGLMAGDALEDGYPADSAQFFDDALAGDAAAVKIVGADEGGHFSTGLGQGRRIHARIQDQHRDAGPVGLENRRNHLARTGGGEADRRDLALNEILDDLHLLFDIQLAFSRLDDERQLQALSRLFGPKLHIHEEGVVEGLHDQGHRRGGLVLAAADAKPEEGE